QTQAPAGREPILHRLLNVRDSRAIITSNHPQTVFVAVMHNTEKDLSISSILYDVARHLRDRGGDHGEIATVETRFCGELPPFQPGGHDVCTGTYGDAGFIFHCR